MNKLSTLVLVASLGLAAPASAHTLSALRGNPFLAKEEAAASVAAKAEDKKAAPVKASKKEDKKAPAAKKHGKKKAAHDEAK